VERLKRLIISAPQFADLQISHLHPFSPIKFFFDSLPPSTFVDKVVGEYASGKDARAGGASEGWHFDWGR